jgi:hypothetical protein
MNKMKASQALSFMRRGTGAYPFWVRTTLRSRTKPTSAYVDPGSSFALSWTEHQLRIVARSRFVNELAEFSRQSDTQASGTGIALLLGLNMQNTIDVLANEGSSLDIILPRALGVLRDSGVNTNGARQILLPDDPSIGRILLYDSKDKERAARILVLSKLRVLFGRVSSIR